MIVVDEGSELRLITQPDHARLAAEILSLWRADGLADRPGYEDLIFATREHDNGWREADAAPSVDPVSGRPLDYLTIPAPRRRELWQRGTTRFIDDRPRAALLILEHGLSLHRDREQEDGWANFIEILETRRRELLDALEMEKAGLESAYEMLALADGLSLALCHRRPGRWEMAGYRGRIERNEMFLEPFPLAGATTFRLPSRVIPVRRYAGDADLGGELATARWQSLGVRIVPEKGEIGRSDAGPGVIP